MTSKEFPSLFGAKPLPAVSIVRPSSTAKTSGSTFDRAVGRLEAGAWSEAYAMLAGLADAGHPIASRLALLLTQRGTRLFGGQYPSTARQRTRWLQAGG